MTQEANTRTVVGVFDDYNGAQQAERDLANNGIPSDAVRIESNRRTGAAGYGGTADPEGEHREGGFSGWLHSLFGGSDHAESESGHYAEAVRRGGAVLSATVADSQVETVVQVLNQYGAVDIEQQVASWRKTGYTGHDPEAQPYTSDDIARERAAGQKPNGNNQAGTSVPVIEEQLQVGKRAVQRGGVRVYSHIVDQPVEEQISLREEHVRVERRPVDRPISGAEVSELRDQTIEVTEMTEEPVVSKRARVREEIIVGKETTEKTETVRDNVRHTEVRVDPIESSAGTGSSAETARRDTSDPAYDYGYQAAGNERYRGRTWADAEEDVRTTYLRENPNGKWEEVKGNVRYGWEKLAGKR